MKKDLNRRELEHVCGCVLEALKVLHEECLVHIQIYAMLRLLTQVKDRKQNNI
jgi:hypothetical protein